MAIERGTWKKVGYGVLAAGVGAAIFGAVHYYFLGNIPAGDVMGITFATLFPFILGTLGLIGAYGFTKSDSTIRNVLLFGSAASIGFGIAQYAGWAVFPSSPSARARAAITYAPQRIYSPPVLAQAQYGQGGTKMI